MNRIIIAIAVAIFAFSTASAGKLYKWVDENGTIHYTDTPVEGAKEINPDELVGVYEAPKLPEKTARTTPSESDEPAYRALDFISPKQDQVFWATGGEIPVYLEIDPALANGHGINLYLNGNLVREKMSTTGTTLTEVYRGAHTLRAVVVDAANREVAATGTITFHVKQRSLANPQTRPRPKPRN